MAKQTGRTRAVRKQAAETQSDALNAEEAAPRATDADTPQSDGEAPTGIDQEGAIATSPASDTPASEDAPVTASANISLPDAVEGTPVADVSTESVATANAHPDMAQTAPALQRAPVTRPLDEIEPTDVSVQARPESSPSAQTPTPAQAPTEEEADPDATAQRTAISAGSPASRPRWNTLAGAITPPVLPQDDTPMLQAPAQEDQPAPQNANEGSDEIGDEVDEWSIADQPTVQLSPQTLPQLAEQARQLRETQPPQSLQSLQTRPAQQLPPPAPDAHAAPDERRQGDFLTETSEHLSWPPSPSITTRTPIAPEDAPTQQAVTPRPPAPRPAARPTRPTTPYGTLAPRRPTFTSPNEPRLASPQGRVVPTPPPGVSPAEMSNPRMRRLQELRRHRIAHEHGEDATDDSPQVAQVVRQWWSDLRPGLGTALEYQHAARSSGQYPIPAHEPAPQTTRLGDVFGRLARTARELTERAQSAAGQNFKRLHDHMEQAAQGLIDRFEGGPARQQAPFLGPGRIAVFFRQGVAVGQAQRLLMNSSARPMRLIPRKHGFLASVRPGSEAAICDLLRRHPYVRDVAYLEYDEYGQPLEDDEENEQYGEYEEYEYYEEQSDDEYDDDIR